MQSGDLLRALQTQTQSQEQQQIEYVADGAAT